MSRSRFGGRRWKKLKSSWSDIKTAYAPVEPPATIHDLAYTDAQGIWNLRSTTQFPKGNSAGGSSGGSTGGGAITYTLIGDSSSIDSGTIVVPATAAAGDIAVLFDSIVGTSKVPTGWTEIFAGSATFDTAISYKILTAGEVGSTVTGQNSSTTYSVKKMLVFRPSSLISTVSVGAVQNSTMTAAKAAAQTIPAHSSGPCIVFGLIRAYPNAPGRDETWGTEYYVSESNGNNMKVYQEIQTTPTARTLTQSADYGSYNHTIGFSLSAS